MKRIALALLVITATVHFGQMSIAKFQADMSSKVSRLDRIGGER